MRGRSWSLLKISLHVCCSIQLVSSVDCRSNSSRTSHLLVGYTLCREDSLEKCWQQHQAPTPSDHDGVSATPYCGGRPPCLCSHEVLVCSRRLRWVIVTGRSTITDLILNPNVCCLALTLRVWALLQVDSEVHANQLPIQAHANI